jgi:hypothetical protein
LIRCGLAAGGAVMALPVARLFAQPAADAGERRLVACYFSGGWDVLIGPDAQEPSGLNGIARLEGPARYKTPFPVTLGGREVLWGGPMRALAGHADVTTLFRGVNMNTVSHPTGRAYVVSGKQPAGTVVRGNAAGTVFAAGGPVEGPDAPALPNVAIGMQSANVDYELSASAVQIDRPEDIAYLIDAPRPDRMLPATVEQLLAEAQDESESCISDRLASSPVPGLALSRERLRRLQRDRVAERFAFEADTTEMTALRARYFGGGAPRPGAHMQAAVASQLLRTGLSRAVSIRLQRGLDTHFGNWVTDQAPRLEEGFDALGALLDDLREDDPTLSRTTVVAFSEFSRTARLNPKLGRDHWFANAFLVFGSILKPGVFGSTTGELGLRRVDLETGMPSGGGTIIKPEHVFATIVKAAGLDYTEYRVEALDAWINT